MTRQTYAIACAERLAADARRMIRNEKIRPSILNAIARLQAKIDCDWRVPQRHKDRLHATIRAEMVHKAKGRPAAGVVLVSTVADAQRKRALRLPY